MQQWELIPIQCIKYAIKAKSNLIHFVLMDNANKHKAMATPFRITLFV